MRDLCRPARPVARLLVVALGLLGIVVGPAGAGAHGGTSPTGTITGVRTGAVQHATARTRSSTGKHHSSPQTQGSHTQGSHAQGSHAQGSHAQAVHAHLAQAGQPPFVAHPALAVLPASGVEVLPPSGRLVRAFALHASPDVEPKGVPRGRAPPTSPRI
ncbi:hypothetical protein ETD83_11985 [Actinomadura soli]|uniref:Uncharacterized protein n=1 Tax=Actinomadura soli TaxID=2508997 RepID=A0A5C4JDT1_9ACTN|nr:hypothetical protein [Actinomadura soli]TMR02652.1 hypothetical protein ETD83_11985 [Actinomadura soli]